MDFYADFYGKQCPAPTENEWTTPEQKTLINLIRNYNDVCGDLQMMLNNGNSNSTTTIKSDIDDLQNRVIELEDYVDYIAKVSKKLLSRLEKTNYNYYTTPVKDEFGTVYDKEFLPPSPPSSDEVLKIDTNGNIWIDGVVQTSATVIGNKIKELAERFNEQKFIQTMGDVI